MIVPMYISQKDSRLKCIFIFNLWLQQCEGFSSAIPHHFCSRIHQLVFSPCIIFSLTNDTKQLPNHLLQFGDAGKCLLVSVVALLTGDFAAGWVGHIMLLSGGWGRGCQWVGSRNSHTQKPASS